jgi:hypothetical protein
MPHARVMSHLVHLHLSLEKKTVAKLRQLARMRAQSVAQIMRDLAESYAKGRVSLQGKESLDQIVRRILALRWKNASLVKRSETLIRSLRNHRT